jgi:hypothetical protein
MTVDVVSSRRRTWRRQWLYLAAAVAVVVACFFVATGRVHLWPGNAEPSPAAEGYTSVGSVDGVDFWLQVSGPNEVGLRTTGRLGGICNDRGPYDAALGPIPVCANSISGSAAVFAYVVSDPLRNVSLPLTAGAVMASGHFSLDGLLPGHNLLVAVVPLLKNQPSTSIDGSPTFS